MNKFEVFERQEALIKKLRDELELKDKCLALIAHDFKGLFTNLLWILNAREKSLINEHEFHSMLPEIKQNAEINLKVINDTFIWVQAQRNQLDLQLKDVKISSLLSEVIESLQESLKHKKILISTSCNLELTFNTSPVLFCFIIKKLLENAIKYSYNNGKVDIEVKIYNQSIRFFVKDYGVGVSSSVMEELMIASVCTGPYGEKGAGMSIPIAKEFARLLNGEIKIYSNNDSKGTVAELIFPYIVK